MTSLQVFGNSQLKLFSRARTHKIILINVSLTDNEKANSAWTLIPWSVLITNPCFGYHPITFSPLEPGAGSVSLSLCWSIQLIQPDSEQKEANSSLWHVTRSQMMETQWHASALISTGRGHMGSGRYWTEEVLQYSRTDGHIVLSRRIKSNSVRNDLHLLLLVPQWLNMDSWADRCQTSGRIYVSKKQVTRMCWKSWGKGSSGWLLGRNTLDTPHSI